MTKIKGSPPTRVYKMTWALVTLGVAVLLCACNGKRTGHTETGRGKVADSSTKHGKADTGRSHRETNLAGGKPTMAKKWVVVSVKKVRKLAAGVPRGCSWCPRDGMLYFQLYGQTASHATQIDTWSVDANGEKLHQTPYEQAGCMSWSPSGLEFSYVPLSIFLTVMDLRSGVTRQISHQFYCGQSSWSPDGKKLVFEAATNAKTMAMPGSHQEAIWVVNADGTGERQIVDRGSNPKWLPDGEKISFANKDGWWLMKPDGSDPQKVIWTQSRSVEVNERAPNGVRLKSFYPAESVMSIDWSADARWVVFSSIHAKKKPNGQWGPPPYPYALAVTTPDGKNKQQLLVSDGVITSPSWSPDGKRIAFCGSDTPVQVGKVALPDYIGIVTLKEAQSKEFGHQRDGVHHADVRRIADLRFAILD